MKKILALVAIVTGLLIAANLVYQRPIETTKAATLNYDVIVVGSGPGGIGAAIQAARMGSKVALIEETDWLGGQMTAAGVSNMDEGDLLERSSGIYKEFVDKVAARYGGVAYLNKCYFGDNTICFEPRIGKEVLQQMITSTGNITVSYRKKVSQVLRTGNTITGVVLNDGSTLNSKIVVDATELGDLFRLGKIAYRVGNSTSENINMNACVQDITYTAVIKKYEPFLPSNLKITTIPPGYNATVASNFAEMVTSTNPNPWASPLPITRWSLLTHNAYRGIPDSSRPLTTTNATESQASGITKTIINFANDYPAEKPNQTGNTSLSVRYVEDEAYRKEADCNAKLKTIQFLYYLHNVIQQSWSVSDDEGFQNSSYVNDNLCSNIPQEFKEIEKRLSVMPYIREGRRMIGVKTLTGADIRRQKQVTSAKYDVYPIVGINMTTSIGTGSYPTDLHGCNTDDTFETGLEQAADSTSLSAAETAKTNGLFQIPFEALIPETVDGFLAAEKNISVSRLANGAIRLQPVSMTVGQSVGALAGLSVKKNVAPRNIRPIDVQRAVTETNPNAPSRISLYKFNDAELGTTRFSGATQVASVNQMMVGDGKGYFNVNSNLTRGELAGVLTRLFGISTAGFSQAQSFSDVPKDYVFHDHIEAMRAKGIALGYGDGRYGPNDSLLKGQTALFTTRALNAAQPSPEQAVSYLENLGVITNCTTPNCYNEKSTRGEMAELATSVLSLILPASNFPPVPQRAMPEVSTGMGNAANLQAAPVNQSITVYASGTKAFGEYAALDLYVRGNKVHSWLHVGGDGSQVQALSYTSATAFSINDVKLVFPNDAYERANNDRNIKVQKVVLGTVQYPITSSVKTSVCGGAEKAATDGWLFCSGDSLTFSQVVALAETQPNTVSGSNNPQQVAAVPSKKPGNPVGWSEGVDAQGVARGWTCDGDDYTQALNVDLYIDGEWFNAPSPAVRTLANEGGESLIASFCGGTVAHRFSYQLPIRFKDGKPHQLYAYSINIGNGNIVLLNSGPVNFVWR